MIFWLGFYWKTYIMCEGGGGWLGFLTFTLNAQHSSILCEIQGKKTVAAIITGEITEEGGKDA